MEMSEAIELINAKFESEENKLKDTISELQAQRDTKLAEAETEKENIREGNRSTKNIRMRTRNNCYCP